ncbi:hypothetical protein DL89DRAFT_266711 [Linderina pennispora]|uniref:Uncharacterized protein n=1 Tax=Linderina pennispora TaxID=61395 RepID=A0A1Y1WAZ3_9FUNG|nr:uncharacterized protein DL89DRAFT_266711 [Linderina pennispora]ORX70498.1 hypothetical protein DL89DRAFT_266711 [Linderina pennispora]
MRPSSRSVAGWQGGEGWKALHHMATTRPALFALLVFKEGTIFVGGRAVSVAGSCNIGRIAQCLAKVMYLFYGFICYWIRVKISRPTLLPSAPPDQNPTKRAYIQESCYFLQLRLYRTCLSFLIPWHQEVAFESVRHCPEHSLRLNKFDSVL